MEISENLLRKAISGYWFLTKKYGLIKAVKYFYSWYYGQYKQRGKDLTKEHLIEVKTGCKLFVLPNDPGISTELIRLQSHEPVTTEFLSKKLKEGMVCLDVGGNIGYYATLESKKVGKSGHVIAVEPSPINFHYLNRNLALQKQENWEIYNLAFGDTDGETNFLVSKFSNLSRIIQKGDKVPFDKFEIINLPMKKIDTFLQEKRIEKLDLIRMDIEGYELSALLGAKETLRKFKPLLQVEIHPAEHWLGEDKTRRLLEYLKNPMYG